MSCASSCSRIAAPSALNCSSDVALAIGAVTLGRAICHASATDVCVEPCFAATASSAARIRKPRGFRYCSTRLPRALFFKSASDRYLPDRKPLASA
ncbi:hypothetical protein DM52_4251 [Burkholderia mallei]|nr:hypothetical protein DM52_4251 [Burkholderia mallei]